MKILRLIARLNVGGPARHVVWLTSGLRDGEYESTLAAGTVPPGEEDMGYLAAEHGVEPFYIKEMSRELSPKDAVSFVKVLRLIRRTQPDIIHTHTAKAGTVGRAAAFAYKYFTPGTLVGRPRRVKIVHTFHGHVFHSYYSKAKTRLFILIEQALARFATDKIITITEQQFAEIHKTFHIGRADQFEVIPLGIDLTAFADSKDHRSVIRESLGVSSDEVLVGFVGRLTEIKNLSMFLKVAEETLRKVSKIRFVIIGDGHLRKELESETANLGIAEKVRFLGNRTDTAALYNALDIVALTSLNEGTPLSLIEAMAAARPVISTKVGGVSDLLGETVSTTEGFEICERGISVPSNNVAAFTKGLIYLAKNEKLRESIGEQGRNFVRAKYSKDRLIADIKQLYKRLTA